MALVNTSVHKIDLRSSSEPFYGECKSGESRVKSEELLKMGEEKRKISGRSVSLQSIDQKLGWPLLIRSSSGTPQVHHWQTRKVSVVNWVMSLPDRFPNHQQNLNSETSFVKKQLDDILRDSSKWFNYNVLKTATSDFSQENLIGKGGCNEVYRGILKDGKGIAVKILKSSSKEATTDFVHEIDIISSLSHQNISPLLGVCVQDNDLISVYNLSSAGSLQETLHGKGNEKHVLSWDERFKIAIGLAEALDYLHNLCSKPVIHRDVKTSNVLLSDELQPQAKPLIETGNSKGLLDPEVTEVFDESQLQRMVIAATRCLTRSATHRPNIRQILRLLNGENEIDKLIKEVEENEDCFDDEVYPNFSAELHLRLVMLEEEDDESASISTTERSNNSLFSSSCSLGELQP
ncbi:unnamed protein product [Thlaspi arvense]|uniref:Protein kinase domain-containing protein n=1 Tax=Thlaspi arvense TaxID=13288 RepID=A0AAU9SYN0_THLAR|nr:unnamed protein product [Thlaspi arvense]